MKTTKAARALGLAAVGLGLVAALGPNPRILAETVGARIHSETAPAPAVSSHRSIRAEGRLVAYPGSEVTIGAEVAGRIARVLVDEKSAVRAGDLVAEIASDEPAAALEEADARIAEVEADVAFLDLQVPRFEKLRATNAGSQERLDEVRHERSAARARRDLAVATRKRLAAALDKTKIRASGPGLVTSRYVQPGETVTPGARIVTIADLSRIRIEAEVDEFDAGPMLLGASVAINAEGFAGDWHGRVEEIPDSVTVRRIKPNDPGRPSDTRVLLVKIRLDGAVPLKLGQRVDVAIDCPGE